MTDPDREEWTDTPDEAPLYDEPGIADDLGPDGGPTPTDVVATDDTVLPDEST